MYSSRDFVSFIKLFVTAGIFSSVLQLACGQDLLLDTLQSIILAVLTGLLSSLVYNLMLRLSSALLHMILILIHFQSSCLCCRHVAFYALYLPIKLLHYSGLPDFGSNKDITLFESHISPIIFSRNYDAIAVLRIAHA